MDIVTDPSAFQKLCWDWRCAGERTALVPTMGFLHAGHASLLQAARERAGRVALSIFVNPTQFGPNEDLDRYPRDPERDAAIAREAGVDVIFMPEPASMYPPGFATWVEVPELGKGLCGASRPGHFRGVVTVVAKLLLLAMPTLAFFGRKDWQQLAVIRRMAMDLSFPVEVVGMPIVREADGLALSSRNVYLTAAERSQAPALYRGLCRMRDGVFSGQADVALLVRDLQAWYRQHVPLGEIDYLEVVDPDALTPLERLDGPALVAVAMRFGRARLIDNLMIDESQDVQRI